MKQRIITAIVGILVLVAVLCFYNTIVLNIAVAVLSVIAVYELLYITKIMRKPLLLGASLFLAVLFPFTQYLKPIIFYCILFCYGCVVVFSMLRWHETIPFSNIAETVLISLLVPASFSIIVWLKLLSDHSFICLLLILAAAWLTDTGAYFDG